MKYIYLFVFTIISFTLYSQEKTNFNFVQKLDTYVNGQLWENAFYGSTTNLTIDFSDLDGDGDLDLIQGSRYRLEWIKNKGTNTFYDWDKLNKGNISTNSGQDWSPSLVDIDDDNDLDIFCGNLEGTISFFENTGNNTNPVFSNVISNYSDIEVNYFSHPTLCDIDNDNDFDLFVGDSEGVIHYFENIGTAQVPNFTEHAGSIVDTIFNNSVSPEFIDIDEDGDFDLFIGVEYGYIKYYKNVGTNTNALWQLESSNFANINIGWSNLKVKFADIDNDNDFDMFITDNKGYFYYYKNIGNNTNPNWSLITSLFNKILNFGRVSAPACGDIDNDGDIDILFGSGDNNIILENVGTPFSPSWHFNDQLNNNPDYLFDIPTLIDIDGDNDLDLFYGDNGGYIKFYENTGTPYSPNWSLISSNYESVNYGNNTHVSVSFADIDGDSDYDMFVQHCNWDDTDYPSGKDLISFYENIGNVNSPQWNLIDENYINIGANNISFGRCNFGDIDNDGDYDLLTGNVSNDGVFYLYLNVGDSNTPEWSYFGEISGGIGTEGGTPYASAILADFNNDSYPEIITGLNDGGMNFWWNESTSSISKLNIRSNIEIYPNPTNGVFIIDNKENKNIQKIKIYNVVGQLIYQTKFSNNTIDISDIPKGIYTIYLEGSNNIIEKRNIIKK